MPNNINQESKSIVNIEKHEWWQPIAKGFLSGTLAGYVCYPYEGWKKSKQSGLPLPRFWELKAVYRGANAFALPLAPVSIVQVSVNTSLRNSLPKDADEGLKICVDVLSGSMGALVSAPVEHIVLTQRKFNIGPIQAIKKLAGNGYTYPWTGLKPLMVREAGFGFTMLTGAEKAGTWLSESYHSLFPGIDLKPVGMIGTGIVGAAVTHPFDTIATRKQLSNNRISMSQAATEVYKKHGLSGFFLGYRHRAFLFTGCALIMNAVNKEFDKRMESRKANLNNHATFFAKSSQDRVNSKGERVSSVEELRPRNQ